MSLKGFLPRNSSDYVKEQVPTLCSLGTSQYLELQTGKPGDEPHQSIQQTFDQSISTKCNRLCTWPNFAAALREHPFAFAIIVVTLIVCAVGIVVGLGVDWQGSASTSEGPCICDKGKIYNFSILANFCMQALNF